MKKNAIEKAKKWMKNASVHFHALAQPRNFEEFEPAWSQFLVAINRAFTALDLGAKDDAKTQTWWSKKKHEWKSDPLLQFLHQARNTDEHGLQSIASSVGPKLYRNDAKLTVTIRGPRPSVVTITNKWGDVFPPPKEHLGKPLHPEEISPWGLGVRAMGYHNRLIIEAEEYVIEPPA
jgi:hypothetical protein